MGYKSISNPELRQQARGMNIVMIKPEGLYFNSTIVDSLAMMPKERYRVTIDEKKERLRLQLVKRDSINGHLIVATAKAGNVTKEGRARLCIRMKELFKHLKINKEVAEYPVITKEGHIIISYSAATEEQ